MARAKHISVLRMYTVLTSFEYNSSIHSQETSQAPVVKVMMIYGTHKKKYDVSANMPASKLLELAQNECGDRNITIELCTNRESDQWVEVKDPLSLRSNDRLRVKKVCAIYIILVLNSILLCTNILYKKGWLYCA